MVANNDKQQALGAFQRRVMSDAAQKFEGADISKLHNLGFVDVTKFGRLSAVEIDEVAKWTKRVLQINDDYSGLSLTMGCNVCFNLFQSR